MWLLHLLLLLRIGLSDIFVWCSIVVLGKLLFGIYFIFLDFIKLLLFLLLNTCWDITMIVKILTRYGINQVFLHVNVWLLKALGIAPVLWLVLTWWLHWLHVIIRWVSTDLLSVVLGNYWLFNLIKLVRRLSAVGLRERRIRLLQELRRQDGVIYVITLDDLRLGDGILGDLSV
jgi:hypothetical protein